MQTVARKGNSVFRSLSIALLLEDEDRYSRLRQKAVQEVHSAFEDQIIQSPSTIVGQAESKRCRYICSTYS